MREKEKEKESWTRMCVRERDRECWAKGVRVRIRYIFPYKTCNKLFHLHSCFIKIKQIDKRNNYNLSGDSMQTFELRNESQWCSYGQNTCWHRSGDSPQKLSIFFYYVDNIFNLQWINGPP